MLKKKPTSPPRSTSLHISAINLLEHLQYTQRALVGNAVMQRLRCAAKDHQPILAQSCEMLRQRRLAQFDHADQLADRHLAAHREKAENQQPLLVSEQFQELSGLASLLRQFLQRESIGRTHLREWHPFRNCNGSHILTSTAHRLMSHDT